MNTLTKLALGLIGQLQPSAVPAPGTPLRPLPAAATQGGLALFEALGKRHSHREFSPEPLGDDVLGQLLWCVAGINRPGLGGRTAPSAMNAQEVRVYVASAQGLFLYDAQAHALRHVAAADVRRVSGFQDFVDTAPLDLIYVADHTRMTLVPAARREAYAFAAAGAMAQNAYLCCAAQGLATVVRAWFDAAALGRAMGLGNEQQLLLAQTVGRPAPTTPP